MALHLHLSSFSLSLPSSSIRRSTTTAFPSSIASVSISSATSSSISAVSSTAITPTDASSSTTEPENKGMVSLLLNELRRMPPRGSIASCVKLVQNELSLPDFAVVFRVLAREGDWQRSLRLFKYMKRHAWCLPNEPIHVILITNLSRDAALLPRCLEVFDSLPVHQRSSVSYTALISAFARHRDHISALNLLRRMTDHDRVAPALATYNATLLACCSADGPDAPPFDVFLGLFADMRRIGLRPNLTSYNFALSAASRRALPDQAVSLLLSMPDSLVAPDPSSFSYLLESFPPDDRLAKCSDVFRQLEAAGNAPSVSCYNVLISAYAAANEDVSATREMRLMQAAGCAPDSASYTTLLSVYGRVGRYDEARELFLEMKSGAAVPDVGTYSTLISVFGVGGLFRETVTLFKDMVEEGLEPDGKTYAGLFFACGRGGLYADAEEILGYMRDKEVVPTSRCYDHVIEAYGHAALYEEALVAFNSMNEVGSIPTIETYSTLLAMYARGGLLKESEAVRSRMNEADLRMNTDTYNGLIEVYGRSGLVEAALKSFIEMQDFLCYPNERTLETFLEIYCITGFADDCRDQFLEIKSLGKTPSVVDYSLLLSVYAKTNRWDDANELLDEMISEQLPNVHQIIGSMIRGYYDDEPNWQIVEYIFDEFNKEGCDFRLRLYNALLDALWWMGHKSRAKKVLLSATSRGVFPELYRESKLVWSVDVHRMSVGGALIAVSSWLNDIHRKFEERKNVPHVASVVVVRGRVEESQETWSFPVAKAVSTFLKDHAPLFGYPEWSNGRITCQRTQLKHWLSSFPTSEDSSTTHEWISITDSAVPFPDTNLHTKEGKGEVAYIH